MTALIIRQIVNNALLVLDLALIGFIVRHLISEVHTTGLKRTYARLGNQAALAILIHIVGLTMIRAWSALLLYYQGQGVDAWKIEQLYPIGIVGASIALIGMGCCIRIFSREEWGNWGWIGSVGAAAVFVIGMQALAL